MRSRLAWTTAFLALTSLLHADAASAQQTLTLSIGMFSPRGEDARVEGDVLIANRDLFLFDFTDFRSLSLTGEWLVPVGDFVEAGGGIGFTTRTVPTIYDVYTRPDGTEIEQELKLRTVPMSATIRLLPLGRNAAFQPYVGGGIGVINYRYSETGDFIDFSRAGRPIYRDSYSATGNAVGPVAVFGARVPFGNFSVGGEVRYQKADADLDTVDFLGPKLDLGGFHYSATVGFRF